MSKNTDETFTYSSSSMDDYDTHHALVGLMMMDGARDDVLKFKLSDPSTRTIPFLIIDSIEIKYRRNTDGRDTNLTKLISPLALEAINQIVLDDFRKR